MRNYAIAVNLPGGCKTRRQSQQLVSQRIPALHYNICRLSSGRIEASRGSPCCERGYAEIAKVVDRFGIGHV